MAEVEGSLPVSSQSVRFSWSSVKIPDGSIQRHPPRFNLAQFPLRAFASNLEKARDFAKGFIGSVVHGNRNAFNRRMPLLCSTSITIANRENKVPSLEMESSQNAGKDYASTTETLNGLSNGDSHGPTVRGTEDTAGQQQKQACPCRPAKEDQERVLISEVLFQNKDGDDLENPELLSSAMGALKACKPNSALTIQEVQEDVHRVIDCGYFYSCMPVAVDTRDGIRLIFKFGPVEGAIFGDYGTDFGSGQTVPGDPAGARNKPGNGYGYGAGIRVHSPLGPLRLEYALNNQGLRRFHFGVGYHN